MKWTLLLLFVFVGITNSLALNLCNDNDVCQLLYQNGTQSRDNYQFLIKKVFNDDDLFVLFYLDLALVVDPTMDFPYVEKVNDVNPWVSISKYLVGKRYIYFCPSEEQITKPIEYFNHPSDSLQLMSDRYDMYRLSSPKELFNERDGSFNSQQLHRAVVFGGLDYGERNDTSHILLDFRGERGACTHYELEKAYEEAICVDSILRRNHLEVSLLTHEKGTEDAFYELPSLGVDILHIATHGEYNPDEDKFDSKSFLEWMLSHSSIALSGIDVNQDTSSNDGKLTAYEISKMDLSSIKLAVLSTCVSGLGDVKENDIYGLIKGFKMAGAGTLLTTLQEVNDTVTQLLMKRFYENIFSGDKPRKALTEAQKDLRSYDNGRYDKPEYWTPFVLIDDIDRRIGTNLSENEKNKFLIQIVGVDDLYYEDSFKDKWDKSYRFLKQKEYFVRFYTYNTNNDLQYVAFIGDNTGWCSIHKICTQYELTDEVGSCSAFNSMSWNDVDLLVWSSMMDKLEDAKRIYVQLSDSLALLPLEDTPFMSQRMYRVTDICQLMTIRQDRKPSKASIFGDLIYDDIEAHETVFLRGAPYLLLGSQETQFICDCLNSNKINTSLFCGYDGTKACFKNQVASNSDILHVATHGFFDDDTKKSHSWHSLSNYLLDLSSIALSGANVNMAGGCDGLGHEGVLSGSEIAELDMENVDLVVLSMSHGLSGIRTTEDFWNLTKAFKLAGVNSILTSINNVIDEPTFLLLTVFYTNWISKGMTKHDALEVAKKYVQISGWEDPKYWASFVLLDALD